MLCREVLSHRESINYAALIAHLPADYAGYAQKLGVKCAAIDCELVDRSFVEDAHNKDLEVWSYTVNNHTSLKKMLDLGVDGIFTDDPPWARKTIRSLT